MKVRTFYAASMQEAIRAIKQELGPDAVILSSRRVRKWGNAFGVLGSSALEVMAAIEEDVPELAERQTQSEPRTEAAASHESAGPSFERSLRAALNQGGPAPVQPTTPGDPAGSTGYGERVRHAGSAGVGMTRQGAPDRRLSLPPGDLSHSLQELYRDLVAQGLRPETAQECLSELQETLRDPDRTAARFMLQLLRGVLTARLNPAGPLLNCDDGQKLALFVGPSGVGKTTSIAKLAAQYRLEEKRSVAMVTIDNYRPAAVEQLRLYANVLGVELLTASTCEEARDCITHLSHTELVLVDTPGFNPRHAEPWNGWTALADLAYQVEVHLVLSATTRIQDIDAAVKRCMGAPALRLLFTKLDETSGYGSIFEAAHHSGLPLSYWGTGPRVPEDLAPAVPDRLVDLLLGSPVPVKGVPDRRIGGDAAGPRPVQHRGVRAPSYVESSSVTSAREQHHE